MTYTIGYLPQAEATLGSLNSEELSQISRRVLQVAESGLKEPLVRRLTELDYQEPVYVLEVFEAKDALLVVFTASRNTITVLDVLNKRFAERYG